MHHSKILFNMMGVFAEEAEKKSKKIQLLTCGSLRQRIALYLLQNSGENKKVELMMNREELAASRMRPGLLCPGNYLRCRMRGLLKWRVANPSKSLIIPGFRKTWPMFQIKLSVFGNKNVFSKTAYRT